MKINNKSTTTPKKKILSVNVKQMDRSKKGKHINYLSTHDCVPHTRSDTIFLFIYTWYLRYNKTDERESLREAKPA